MLRGLYHQIISLRPALVETAPGLAVQDQLVLGLLQLEGVHVGPLVDGPRMEQKVVGRDGEQRLCHLRHAGQQEVLNVLAAEDDHTATFSYPFHGVADVGDRHRIGEENMEFLEHPGRVPAGDQGVADIG